MNRIARIAGHVNSSMEEQESFLGSLAGFATENARAVLWRHAR